MKTRILLNIILFAQLIGFGQKEPENTVTFQNKINDVYLHQTTGIPVITTNGGVYGINAKTGEKIWGFEESSFVASLNSFGQDGGSLFSEIELSPFGRFNQTIFNIKNGKIVIDPTSNGYEKLIDNKFVYSKKAVLFVGKIDANQAKLMLASIESNSVLWETNITTDKKLESLFGDVGGISEFSQNKDRIAFIAGKTVFLINSNTGKLLVSENYDAGRLFFNEDDKSLIAVENKSSSLIGGAIKAGLTMGLSMLGNKPIGKELISFDVNTGEKVWKKPIKLDEGFTNHQFVNNKLFVIHKDGANLFDYKTGEGLWKKDFKMNKVLSAEKTQEGYMVYYKNKKMLLDENGKELWKKPQKVTADVDFELEEDEDYTAFDYNAGTIFVTPYRIEYFKKGEEKRDYKISLDNEKDKLSFNDKNNDLILLKDKNLYLLNPDRNLGKDQLKKIDLKEPEKITTVEIRDKGYFINSNWEYAITDFDGNIIKNEYFKQPGEGLRLLKNIGSALSSLGATEVTVSQSKPMETSSEFVYSRNAQDTKTQTFYVSKNHQEFEDLSNYLYTPERYNAFKVIKNSAFFYTSQGDKKVLVQVNKDKGDIVDSYEFGVNNPKYEIDMPISKIYYSDGKELKIFSYND